ncbi:MAG: MBL fold metallo-hydrolase [Candidatus Geothermincolia bacterium]
MTGPEIHIYQPATHMWPSPANSFMIKDADGAVLIDAGCGFPECYQKIREFLAGHGLQPSDVHTVLLSHAHPDHMGAMPFLLEESSPRIFLHPLEKPLAADNSLLNVSFDMSHISEYYADMLGGAEGADILDYFSTLCPMGAAVATDTMEDGDVLDLAGRRLEVIHTPGHAPGHVSLYDRENRLLLSGDVIGAVVAWYCPSGGGARGYLESLDKIESLDIDVILPSHGGEMTDVRGAIDSTRAFIMARETRILELLGGGEKSLLELTEALFPRETTRMFPGVQATHSHLIKLEEDGAVRREDREGLPFFSLETPG